MRHCLVTGEVVTVTIMSTVILTLSQTSPGFYVSAVQGF